jgi:hypothetical protein
VQIEMKDASNAIAADKALTFGERDTMKALARNQVRSAVAWDVRSFYAALVRMEFRLHP